MSSRMLVSAQWLVDTSWKKLNLIEWPGTLAGRWTLTSARRQAAEPASDILIIIISWSLADGKHIRLALSQLV